MTERVEGLVRHRRSEVGPPDPNVDNVRHPVVRSNPIREHCHGVKHRVHVRHDVDTIDLEARISGHSERDMTDGAVFGHVDALTGEHRIAPLLDAGALREFDQRPNKIIGDPLLRHVDPEVSNLEDVALGAPRIVGKQCPQVWWLRKVGQVSEFHRWPP